jgi:hypothetical protein
MSTLQEMPLQHLSICPCGYSVLDDRITVGTRYTLDMATVSGGFRYFCGGCRKWHEGVTVVKASQVLHPERPMAMLPYGLFVLADPVKAEAGRLGGKAAARARRARKDGTR